MGAELSQLPRSITWHRDPNSGLLAASFKPSLPPCSLLLGSWTAGMVCMKISYTTGNCFKDIYYNFLQTLSSLIILQQVLF